MTYTLAKVDQYGPINGGLFLEDDVIEIGPGTKFTPDHDQRHALSAEVSYENDRIGLWVAVDGRYRSGTPLEVDEEELGASRTAGSGSRGLRERARQALRRLRRAGRPAAASAAGASSCRPRASVFNLTDARYAFNFGNPFSGTHFGAPRSVRLDLRLALR